MMKFTRLFVLLSFVFNCCSPAFADPENIALGVTGVVIGVPFGMANGLHRGPVTKTYELGETFSEAIGDGGPISKTLGYTLAFIPGVIGGLAGGVVKGAIKGVHFGYNEPFSLESINMDSEYFDFDAWNYDDLTGY